MLNSGIVVPADGEPTEWASLAFPRRKPNSYPPKCRWVADFRDLNRALDRPVWGGESSGQLLQHLDPSADPESSKLLLQSARTGAMFIPRLI